MDSSELDDKYGLGVNTNKAIANDDFHAIRLGEYDQGNETLLRAVCYKRPNICSLGGWSLDDFHNVVNSMHAFSTARNGRHCNTIKTESSS